MYQNEYDKSLEYVKTAVECIKDYQNIKGQGNGKQKTKKENNY